MKREHTYYIWPKNLDFSDKLALIQKFAAERKMIVHKEDYRSFRVKFNRYESASTSSVDEFLRIIKKNPHFENFSFEAMYRTKKRDKGIQFHITLQSGCIYVAITTSDDDLGVVAHSFVRNEFGLNNPNLSEADHDRAKYLQATIFLGRHFDEQSQEPSQILNRFLSLIGFRIIEGDEYRAEPIPDKVKKLIEGQDIYVGLVIGNREHNWLVAESAYARGRDKHIIMIVEEGSNFHPSIHGKDFEQIPIKPSHVEQSFIKLLQEFRSIGITGL
ncbi:MAG TPA: hypothetical protein VGM58_01370 [Verrucomicrobiae bacterium]|jgi:hypothetical protein